MDSVSQHNSSVYVTAPGVSIVSTTINDNYARGSGTSYAAPFVTAMAAAAKAQWGDSLTTARFQKLLQCCATDKGAAGYDEYYGHGIINLHSFAVAMGYDDLLDHWGYSYAISATDLGLFEGTAPRTFSPDTNMSRAMFVTVLGRLYESKIGPTIANSTDPFTDTEDNTWYSQYVSWAASNGIVDGYSATCFGPNDSITREQAAAIMYRFSTTYLGAGSVNSSALMSYSDNQAVSDWAVNPMAWAVSNGIIQGTSSTTLSPQGSALRAQSATIIVRYCTFSGILS